MHPNQQTPPLNFDFINQQPAPEPKKGPSKKILAIIFLLVLLLITAVTTLILGTGNKEAGNMSMSGVSQVAVQQFISGFHQDIKQSNFDQAYSKLLEETKPPRELFESGTVFIKNQVDTSSCVFRGYEQLESGAQIYTDCKTLSGNGNISIEYLVITSGVDLSIVRYKLHGQ